MKGIGRGTIQRCDARPLTAPFLLMFHNYYHAINSNGTGGRPLRKRHSSARVINIRFWFAENSLCRSQPSPFLSPFFLPSFFFFHKNTKNRKRFPRSLANCPLFSPPPFRTHFSLFTRDYAGTRSKVDRILAFVRSAGSCTHSRFNNPPFSPPWIWIFPRYQNFSSRSSPDRWGGVKVKWKEETILSIRKFYLFFFFEFHFRARISPARVPFTKILLSRFFLSFFLSFPEGRVLQRFTANLENVQTRERERERENGVIPTRIAVRFFYRWWYWKWTKVARFLDDVADLSPTDGSSIDFPASIPRTDWSARDIREKSIFTLTSSLSRFEKRREESWLFLLFFSPLTVFSLLARLSISILLFIKRQNRKPLF